MNYNECTIEELVKYSNSFKIGIYYDTAQFAQFIYDKLIERFKEMGCLEKCYVSSNGVGYIKLNNGIIYRLVKTNINYRGYRFDKIYYQKGIDNNILNDIIIPQLYGCNLYKIIY